jgi:chromate transport protein ChrA
MKLSFRTIAKLGLLLVIIGFLMPIACDMNGFQLANYMTKNEQVFEGLLFYLLFVSAVIGLIIGALLLMKKNVNPNIDWLVIVVCIATGLFLYFTQFKNNVDLQNGAYVILTGWIISLVFQIVSVIKKE